MLGIVLKYCLRASPLQIQKCTITVSALVQLLDVVTDIALFVSWYNMRQFEWFGLGISFVILGAVMSVGHFNDFTEDNENSAKRFGKMRLFATILLSIFGISPLYFIFSVWNLAEYDYEFDRHFGSNRIGEVIESIPSSVLQLYILVGKTLRTSYFRRVFPNGWGFLDVLSLSTSIFSVVSPSKFHYLTYYTEEERHAIKQISAFSLDIPFFVWVGCELLHRALSFVLILHVVESLLIRILFIPVLVAICCLISFISMKRIDFWWLRDQRHSAPYSLSQHLFFASFASIAPTIGIMTLFFDDLVTFRNTNLVNMWTLLRAMVSFSIGIFSWYGYEQRAGSMEMSPESLLAWIICCCVCSTAGFLITCLQLYVFGTSVNSRVSNVPTPQTTKNEGHDTA